jgi:nucleoside-diphosphate-sugar epimerase
LNPKNPVWANAGAASNNDIPGWEPLVPAREGLRRTLDWFAGRSSRTEASPARR